MKTTTMKTAIKTFTLLCAILLTGGAWAEYVAGWDFKGLAKSQWETSTGTAIALDGSAPHTWSSMPENEYVFTVDFTVDALPEAAGAIASWKMADNFEIAFVKSVTTDGSANLYLAWGYWAGGNVNNNWTTYLSDGKYTAWTADTSSHTFRIEYDHSNLTGKIRGTRVFMDGVKICDVDGLRFANKAVQGLVLGGCTGSKGQEAWPNSTATFSNVTYSSGTSLQDDATLTSNGYTLKLNGCILNADGSVSVIGTTGLSVEFADGDGFYNSKEITAVIEMSSLPTSGTVVDYKQDDGNGGRHVGVSIKSATKLAQSWGDALNSTSWNQGYNDIDCSTLGGKHTVAFAYNGAWVGGQTFVDGSAGCNNYDGLYDSSHNLRKLYVGSLNGTSAVALGMRVYSIKLYTTKLDASGAAAAASDVILSDGCSAAFSSGATYKYCGSGFTNGFTIDLAGQTVALGTYPGTSGTITVNDSVGGGSATMTLPEGFTGSFAGTGKLAVTAPASILPVSGGMDLSGKTVTIPNASGTIIAANSITVGNSGLQISYTESQPLSVMMKVENIPSVASSMVGLAMSGLNTQSQQTDVEIVASRTTTGFQNGWLNTSGTFAVNNGNGWGAASSNTVDPNTDHWFTYTFQHNSGGTKAYLDGSAVAAGSGNNGLRWENIPLTVLTLGGSSFTTTALAPTTGMVIKQVSVFQTELSPSQVAKITTALNNGWTVDTVGTMLTSDEDGSSLPGYSNVTAVGTVTVASDGTLNFSGLTAIRVGNGATFDISAITGLSQVVVLPGGELTIGKQRPSSVAVLEGGTLNVSSNDPTVNDLIVGYTPIVELSILDSSYFTGTVKLDGATVTPSIDGTTATLTGVAVAGNATYTGSGWWWDYEFNESSSATIDGYRLTTPNEGNADDVALRLESSNADYTSADETGNRELYFQQTPWRNASFSTLSELTAVMYCAPGNYANTVLVAFGSTTASGKKAIALVTGANPAAGEMKLVLTDGVATKVTELADLTAVGATTTKHLYAFIMDRITENETEKTRVRVYLDGKVKAIYKHNGILTLSDGFQIGSLHGGVAPAGFNTGLTKYSSSGNSGTLDFLRVIDGTLTDGAMAALAGAYPYNSAYGEATRDPISSAANWVATDVWTQKVPNQSDATQDAPNADTNVKLSIDGDSAVSVALNLTTDSNYESLTLSKEAGATGSLKLTSGMGNSTAGKLVSAETSVLVDTTVPAGRVNLGVTSVADGITLTVDPYSPFGNTALAAKFNTMAFGDIYEDVIISMALLGDDAAVELDETYKSSWEDAGFTIELIYDSSNLSYTLRVTREAATADIRVEIAAGGTVTWSTRTIPVPAPESLPDTYANTVTITNMTESAVAISTAFAGGNVTVASGGPVTLSGAITTSGTVALNSATTLSGNTVSSALTGSGAVTINDTVTIADGGSIANTINGSGTIDCSGRSSKPGAFAFGTWTGTVVLPELASIAGDTFSFNSYGIEGSTVCVNGIGGGWLRSEEVNPTIYIPAGKTLTISDFSASFVNTFKALSGAGTFAVTYNTAIDTTSGSWYSNYSAYFLVKNVSNFTGSLSTATPGIVIGSAKPAYATAGGKIILTTSATIATGKTWTATEGIVLADAAATLTNTDGALDPAPTTSLADKRVKVDINVYSLVDAIPGSGGDAGYVDGTTAIITNTTSAVTIPVGATAVAVSFSTGSEITLTSTAAIALSGESQNTTIYATDASGAKTSRDITSAFKVTAGANNTYTVELDPDATVGEVSVTPEVDTEAETAPMAFDSTAPVFTIKAIPGLWYAVEAADSIDGLDTPSYGDPVLADDTGAVNPVAPEFSSGTVKYYRIGVAPSKAALVETPQAQE